MNHHFHESLELTRIILAPTHQQFSTADYNGPLRNEPNEPHENVDVVVMTRLQIAMSREIGGWPLYTIVIGLGQVRPSNLFPL